MTLTNEIADLICDLEYIIGYKCHNPRTYNGRTDTEGLTYRYPATFTVPERNCEIKADSRIQYSIYGDITPEIVKTVKYKMGSNHLYIGSALIDILEALEKRYNINFNELEADYRKRESED